MLFPNVKVPPAVRIGSSDFGVVEHEASQLDTTAQSVIGIAPELVATWGRAMLDYGLHEDFKQCLVGPSDTFEFDIGKLAELREKGFSEREAAAREMGINTGNPVSKVEVSIDPNTAEGIRIASGYYKREPKLLIGLTVSLVVEILKAQNHGETYTLYPDGITPIELAIG